MLAKMFNIEMHCSETILLHCVCISPVLIIFILSVLSPRLPEATATGWSLMAAVRSFLHFSQLSAWLSVSGGRRPPNVLYRLTVTSPVFCSKFTAEAEEHVFPITYMGQDTSIKVGLSLAFQSVAVIVLMVIVLHV